MTEEKPPRLKIRLRPKIAAKHVPQRVRKTILSVEVPALPNEHQSERRLARILSVQALYAYACQKELSLSELFRFEWEKSRSKSSRQFAAELVRGTLDHLQKIDELIKPRLVNWDFDRVSPVNKAILRLSIYCLLFRKDVPAKVTINEGVDLTKLFSDTEDYKFVNALLDRIRREVPEAANQAPPQT